MAEFLKEYGPIIIIAVAITVIVLIVKSDVIKSAVQDGLVSIIKNFTSNAVSSTPTPTP